MRKLPIYFLIDTSGSMYGEKIRTVNTVIKAIIGEFKKDPYCLETAFISIITFNIKADVIVPLTGLIELRVPTIESPQSGAGPYGIST